MLVYCLRFARCHLDLQHTDFVILKNDPVVAGCGYNRIQVRRCFSLRSRCQQHNSDHQFHWLSPHADKMSVALIFR